MSAQFWGVCWEFVGRGFNSCATSISFSFSFGIGSVKVEVTLPHRPMLSAGGDQGRAKDRRVGGCQREDEAGVENMAKTGTKPEAGFSLWSG